jgi:hypothetical protein
LTAVKFVVGRRTVCTVDAISIRRGGLLRQETVDRPYPRAAVQLAEFLARAGEAIRLACIDA